eukprot:CAMPEP_0178914686 /NCGR_PEP_ID=MMETSP0786-20121207/11573_1 /TAXON_ID=186022 /ORGANISM="Thalassionema frauenfeldii, Strain CCMP 1798" /LENGTH=245 /DNA_ID=CAMNT_0020587641 /DNA_START=121 /DNA_END=861 /DNA_ORIENTATION=-
MTLGDKNHSVEGRGAKEDSSPSRSERKSIREKRRRNELNEALDSLASVLNMINPDMECSYLSHSCLSIPRKRMKPEASINITNRVDLINYASKVLKRMHEENGKRSLAISSIAPQSLQTTDLLAGISADSSRHFDALRSLRKSQGSLAAASIMENGHIPGIDISSLSSSTLPFPSFQSRKIEELMFTGLPSISVQARSQGMQVKDSRIVPVSAMSADPSILHSQRDKASSSKISALQVLSNPLQL